jgi:glycerophosphoryl diester phosphodiesterase
MNGIESKILIIGHKGASAIEPENTLRAFKTSIELGADYVEFDVHSTKDDELVIIHDAETLRTTGVSGIIKEMTLDEIKKLDAGKGEQIPTLKELIAIAKGKIGLQIEIKAFSITDLLLDLLIKENLLDTSIISCFVFGELLNLKKRESNLKLGHILPEGLKSIRGLKRKAQKAIDNGFYSIHPHFSSVNKEFIEFAHDIGLKVNVWTVNDRTEMENLIKMGVDGIITDDVALAKELVNRYS